MGDSDEPQILRPTQWVCSGPSSLTTGAYAEDSSNTSTDDGHDAGPQGILTLELGSFTLGTLKDESVQLGMSVEELARFALLYYLADRDSRGTARGFSASQPLGELRAPRSAQSGSPRRPSLERDSQAGEPSSAFPRRVRGCAG